MLVKRVQAGVADDDGIITVDDALYTLNYLLRTASPSAEQQVRCDVAPVDLSINPHQPKPDGAVDLDDVIIMLRRAAGFDW